MTPETPKFPDSPISWENDARFFLARLPVLMPNSTAEGIINVNALFQRANELIREARNQALEEGAKWIRAQNNGDDGDEYSAGYNDGLKAAASLLSFAPLREILGDALKHKDGQP